MEVTRTFGDTRERYRGRVGLLPTLGYFHEGHLRLMDMLRERCDTLVVSLFVNPTQFNQEEDFDAYPRDEGAIPHSPPPTASTYSSVRRSRRSTQDRRSPLSK